MEAFWARLCDSMQGAYTSRRPRRLGICQKKKLLAGLEGVFGESRFRA